ncbi:MAG: Asp23/Gls24 family envelope stress response protein [Ruminococcus sp.]|nr:Asp23/Gls24 family envelope stress response protein [Ruminococcus sp.]MDE7098618.1 Asp23/Gls24 family envelope stress response protein [Ruminococcus sp.]
MDDVKKTISGNIKISEDVIMTVAKLAATDVKGVAGLCGEINKMSKLRNNGAVIISTIDDVVAIDVKIKVKSGVNVTSVAQEVQTAVKDNVQSMTGVAVARVNVIIGGIVFN